MQRFRFNIPTVLLLMALAAVVTAVISIYATKENYARQLDEYNRQTEQLKSFLKAKEDIERDFVGDSDPERLVQGAVSGMIESLDDPWSHYLDPKAYAEHTEVERTEAASLGIEVVPVDEGVRVVSVEPGFSAETKGLQPDDIITHIDGHPLSGESVENITNWMKGETFTNVILAVLQNGVSVEMEVMRQKKTQDLIERAMFDSIGYIRIHAFDELADVVTIEAVDQMLADGATGFIFDVRNNPGGKLEVLHKILDRLLDNNGPAGDTLITLRNKKGEAFDKKSDPTCVNLPMAVLVNGDSYSAAEFFAACMQEFGKATIIGEPTKGKGYAQSTIVLPDNSALLLSTSEYFTPMGRSLANVGVTPDMEVSLEDKANFGKPGLDAQLGTALEELTVGR